MDVKAELERAELLTQQIKRIEEERERIFNRVTRETFWLKVGDLIVEETRRRRSLLGKVKTTSHYHIVRSVSAYDTDQYTAGRAEIGVYFVDQQSGLVNRRVTGGYLVPWEKSNIRRLGHIDDHETIERVDLSCLTSDKA